MDHHFFLEEKKNLSVYHFPENCIVESAIRKNYRYCDSLHLERIKLIVIKWSYDNSELSAKGIELNVSP